MKNLSDGDGRNKVCFDRVCFYLYLIGKTNEYDLESFCFNNLWTNIAERPCNHRTLMNLLYN